MQCNFVPLWNEQGRISKSGEGNSKACYFSWQCSLCRSVLFSLHILRKREQGKKIRRVKGKRILDMTSSLRPRYFLFLRVIWTRKIKENASKKLNCWHTCTHWNNLQADVSETFQKQQQQNTCLRLRPSTRNYSLGVFILREKITNNQELIISWRRPAPPSPKRAGGSESEAGAPEAICHPRSAMHCSSRREKPPASKMPNTPYGCPMNKRRARDSTELPSLEGSCAHCSLPPMLHESFLKSPFQGQEWDLTMFLFHWLMRTG